MHEMAVIIITYGTRKRNIKKAICFTTFHFQYSSDKKTSLTIILYYANLHKNKIKLNLYWSSMSEICHLRIIKFNKLVSNKCLLCGGTVVHSFLCDHLLLLHWTFKRCNSLKKKAFIVNYYLSKWVVYDSNNYKISTNLHKFTFFCTKYYWSYDTRVTTLMYHGYVIEDFFWKIVTHCKI